MSGQEIIFGIVVPAAVFAFSFAMTYLLYRHFAGKTGKEEASKE